MESSFWTRRRTFLSLVDRNVIDAEYEREEVDREGATAEKELPQGDVSLFDLSLDSADPRWKETRIPFFDVNNNHHPGDDDGGEHFIDAKLAFMVELDGIQYGIGVPFEACVAITIEETSKDTLVNVSPDDDENIELMEIFAGQLKEHVGEDLTLKRTPRVLTVEGDLEKYTKDWKQRILPDPIPASDFMDDTDESEEWFHNFMREELGEKEYQAVMNEPEQEALNDLPEELLELFDIPGLGTCEDDEEGIDEMFRSIFDAEADLASFQKEANESIDHDGAALKLLSYKMDDGKAYSLVKLFKPYALVGKYIEPTTKTDQGLRFELLTREEEKVIVPRLEEICKNDLDAAGFSF